MSSVNSYVFIQGHAMLVSGKLSDRAEEFMSEWRSGRHSDAKIVLDDGRSFPIYKILLAMGSSFFDKMFIWEADKREYKISNVTSEVMDQILDWMYCRKLALTENNVTKILEAAHYLDCFEVVEKCNEYLKDRLDPENAIGFLSFAVIYQIKELENMIMFYIEDHFRAVVKQEEFLELPVENLIQILRKDYLDICDKSIFYALMSWLVHDQKEKLITDSKTIRLGGFTQTFFHKVVTEQPTIFESERKMDDLKLFMEEIQEHYDDTEIVILEAELTVPRAIQDIILTIGGISETGHPIPCGVAWHRLEKCFDRIARSHMYDCALGAAVIGSKLYLVGGAKSSLLLALDPLGPPPVQILFYK